MFPPHALSYSKTPSGLPLRCRKLRRGGALLGLFFTTLAPIGCLSAGEEPGRDKERTIDAQSPIEGGYDDSVDEAVAGVARRNEEGLVQRICSGTLIAPNLILTAQHCVSSTPSRVACSTARFGAPDDPGELYATMCDSLKASCTNWLPVREVLRPPGDASVCGNDVALLLLASSLPSEQVTPLTPRLDEPPVPGETYSAVGFGRTDNELRDSGLRRRRDNLEVACVGTACRKPTYISDSEWQGERGTCKGDSGGPALDMEGEVIGVSSRGALDCARPIYSGLTDHRDWIINEGLRAAIVGGYTAPAWIP